MATELSDFSFSPSEVFDEVHDSELLWGTYRPQVYFGMKTRTRTDTLVFGLMWYTPNSPTQVQLRHMIKSDDRVEYRWQVHDGRQVGSQRIIDHHFNIEITTEFLKKKGRHGGDWILRVHCNNTSPETKMISLMAYMGLENARDGHIGLHSPATANRRVNNKRSTCLTPFSQSQMQSCQDTHPLPVILPWSSLVCNPSQQGPLTTQTMKTQQARHFTVVSSLMKHGKPKAICASFSLNKANEDI